MKNLFQCEKCGKIFDSENAYDECTKHESMHYVPASGYEVENPVPQAVSMYIHSVSYDEKHLEPVSFVGYIRQEYWDGNEWKTDVAERRYKLADK